jgi:putative transposase
MEANSALGIQQVLTSYTMPKGNADTERVMRTLTEECCWLQEWPCPFAFIKALGAWVTTYNEHDLPSALGATSPRRFERDYDNSPKPPFLAA